MLNIKLLLENGYGRYEDQFKRHKEFSPEEDAYKGSYQKCVRDDQGKKYFINIDTWDFANSFARHQNLGREMSFMAHAQFTLPNGDNVNFEYLSVGNKTIAEIEEWFAKTWSMYECRYYEKNDQA